MSIISDKVERYREQVYEYLEALRESSVVNMWGATPYIMDQFPTLTDAEAGALLVQWMDSKKKGE